ncbi:MAG: YdeI/OmpD-associated family protein [Nevskia sp.]|nr:YdeI/OmpD-associated family protein [Nevskia sp.]
MKMKFEAVLQAKGPGGAWTFLPIPFDVKEAFGTKGRIAVAGTVNGFAFQNSLMPEGDGTHSMMFSKELQAGAAAKAGDRVKVVLEPDRSERTVTVPPELQKALDTSKAAAELFSGLTHSQKKEYADWVASAKQPATRDARAAKAVELLAEGKKRLR